MTAVEESLAKRVPFRASVAALARRAALPLLVAACASAPDGEAPPTAVEGLTGATTGLSTVTGNVFVQAGPTAYLAFDASAGELTRTTGLVEYANSLGEFFAGDVTCLSASGNEAGISGHIALTNLQSTAYFFVEVFDGGTTGDRVRVRMGAIPFDCNALSHTYPGAVLRGAATVTP